MEAQRDDDADGGRSSALGAGRPLRHLAQGEQGGAVEVGVERLRHFRLHHVARGIDEEAQLHFALHLCVAARLRVGYVGIEPCHERLDAARKLRHLAHDVGGRELRSFFWQVGAVDVVQGVAVFKGGVLLDDDGRIALDADDEVLLCCFNDVGGLLGGLLDGGLSRCGPYGGNSPHLVGQTFLPPAHGLELFARLLQRPRHAVAAVQAERHGDDAEEQGYAHHADERQAVTAPYALAHAIGPVCFVATFGKHAAQ